MKITSKVGAILGRKQKSEDATFGEPLNLGQIALSDAIESEPSLAESETELVAPEREPTSILDLDFMAAPLAEIELIQEKEQNNPSPVDEADVTSPDVDSDQARLQQDVIQSDNKTTENLAANYVSTSSEKGSISTQDPQNSHQTIENEPPLPTLSVATTAKTALNYKDSTVETALAQTLRSDIDTGFMIFGPNGLLLESTPSFDHILNMPHAERTSVTSYLDILRYIGPHADFGDKDVDDLSQKEYAKMLNQLALGVAKSIKWVTTMRSGRKLEFTNKYTVNKHLVTLVRDVTERIENDRLLRAGLELGTVGYWSYYFKSGKSTLSDYMINRLSKAELSRVEKHGIISIIHPEDADRVQADFDKAISNKTRMDCEFRIVLDNEKEIFMRMIGEAEYSQSSRKPDVFIAFLNDLTQDKKRAKELNDVKETSKNKSNFLARMSHEIRTPLNAIVGMTDALRDEVDNDEARETASYIADAAENLNNILNQTLEHERLSTSKIILDEDSVDLHEVVKSTAAMWKKPCIDKGLKLDIRVSADMPKSIMIDSSRLRQCLTNLMSNAVKFTKSGSIVIAVAPMNLETDTPRVLLAVRDTGIGMSPEATENMFKPYQQANTTIQRRFGGSGLGMAITLHIVKAMGGDIKVKSVEGEGSTVAITLPLKVTNPKAARTVKPATIPPITPSMPTVRLAESQATETLPAETFHSREEISNTAVKPDPEIRKNVAIVPSDYSGFDVLIVEDNPINQAVVKKLLNNHIRSMNFAFHGQEALEILETKAFDVILMDIHMPVKDGIETTLEIRNSGKAWADTVIVALTADPDYQQKRVCRNIGMNDALSKPVKRQELLDVMQRVLNDRIENMSTLQTAQSA